MIELRVDDSAPVCRQIVDGIRMQIASGALAVGAPLPSVRALAAQLEVNANTVAKAYAELNLSGWLISRPGVGSFARRPVPVSDASERLELVVRRFVQDVVALGVSTDEAISRVSTALSRVSMAGLAGSDSSVG